MTIPEVFRRVGGRKKKEPMRSARGDREAHKVALLERRLGQVKERIRMARGEAEHGIAFHRVESGGGYMLRRYWPPTS